MGRKANDTARRAPLRDPAVWRSLATGMFSVFAVAGAFGVGAAVTSVIVDVTSPPGVALAARPELAPTAPSEPVDAGEPAAQAPPPELPQAEAAHAPAEPAPPVDAPAPVAVPDEVEAPVAVPDEVEPPVALPVEVEAPVAVPDYAEVRAGRQVTLAVLRNDRLAAPAATVEVVSLPRHGEAEVQPDLTVAYLAGLDFEGEDRFTYRVCTEDACTSASALVVVAPAPARPARTAQDPTASASATVVGASTGEVDHPAPVERTLDVAVGGEVDVPLVARHVASEGARIRVVDTPVLGHASVEARSLRYAAGSEPGIDRFRFWVCTPGGRCGEAQVTVRVRGLG